MKITAFGMPGPFEIVMVLGLFLLIVGSAAVILLVFWLSRQNQSGHSRRPPDQQDS